MRKLGLSLLVCSMALAPYAALSQESQTADDFVCALSGECAEPTPDAAAQPEGTPRVSATRGFSLSRPTTTARPKASTPSRPQGRQSAASRPQQQRPAPPAQPGRADLRVAVGAGSTSLAASDQAQVRAFAEALRRPQLANIRVRIEGHTDSSGGRTVNLSLSQRRAQAVADYLVAQGIAAGRLEVRGYGYDRPLAGRPASARENRRVEAVRIS